MTEFAVEIQNQSQAGKDPQKAKELMTKRRALVKQSLQVRQQDPEQYKKLQALADQLEQQAIALGGVSAEDMQYVGLLG